MTTPESTIAYTGNEATVLLLEDYLNVHSEDHGFLFSRAVDIAEYARKIKKFGNTFEAWREQKLIGVVAGYFNDPERETAFITLVLIDGSLRKQGIGKKLMSMCIEHARTQRFQKLSLQVNKKNQTALVFYRKQGFIIAEESETQYLMILPSILDHSFDFKTAQEQS